MPNVEWKNPLLVAREKDYKLIDDVISGEQAIKARREVYLPAPHSSDDPQENTKRYNDYLTRAVFYNVGERTLNGLVGAIFAQEPEITVPTELLQTVDDATGENVSITQLMKRVARGTLSHGRTGLFTDYPQAAGIEATVAMVEAGEIRPTITAYKADNIINWRTRKRGAKTILCLVVLKETYTVSDDGFEEKRATQYRVLELSPDNIYYVQVWRSPTATSSSPADTSGGYQPIAPKVAPLKHDGTPFNAIPFAFIGSENNDSSVDAAPMYALCSLNIGHYRNSADYEESCYITGQGTPVLTGLTEAWVKNVLKGRVELGSRAAISLPQGASASLLQMTANSAPFEAMQHKERQMVALGAKLVEQKAVQRTATEAGHEQSSENSVLSTIANNVRFGFLWALGWACDFVGVPETSVKVVLSSDLNLLQIPIEQQRFIVEAWQKEAITFSEMRTTLRKTGIASLDDAKAMQEIVTASQNMPDDKDGDDDITGDDGKPTDKVQPKSKGEVVIDE